MTVDQVEALLSIAHSCSRLGILVCARGETWHLRREEETSDMHHQSTSLSSQNTNNKNGVIITAHAKAANRESSIDQHLIWLQKLTSLRRRYILQNITA